jgi:hypothetical protein
MNFLSLEQHGAFVQTNELFGLGPQEYTAQLSEEEIHALPQTRSMSSTGNSDFPRHYISIGSIQEMRKLAGFPEKFATEQCNCEPPYPEPWERSVVESLLAGPRSSLKPMVPQHIADQIAVAAVAYVMGDPAKVESHVPLINALIFPARAAVFTGETLIVPDGAVHVIEGDDPVILNYGQIVIGANATIRLRTVSYLKCQLFNPKSGRTAAAEAGGTIFDFSGAPWTEPAAQGPQGDTGPPQTGAATNGASHYDGGVCQWICETQPRNGLQGNDGGTGKTGTNAERGKPSPAGVHRLGRLTAPATVIIGGGNGQKGGKGGTGGDGGQGGLAGSTANGCNNNVNVGPQGRGGKGGPGGTGGPGGNSGFVALYYEWNGAGEGITVQVRDVQGGGGGDPGDPGKGPSNLGPGGPGDHGTAGDIPKFSLNKDD